jgi:glutamyl-tRNA(Gln) amidotransferase subunit E
MKDFDYEKLGFKCGLEIHQQLNTKKLFCRTPSTLEEESDFVIERKLRPVASELGELDKAASDAFKRNETFYYKGKTKNISLVELDEEPPQPLNQEALRTLLEIALMCNSKPVDEAVVMRKTVIDGSNTSAFQRTMLVSLGGEIKTSFGKVGVETIVLEEDACRPIKKEKGKIEYNLDRLGIPLIELATAPDIKNPKEAVETAKKIGEIMRLTCKTKRGKGTIRQDVNVSIKEGARCEIKGCQNLEQIEDIARNEVKRQLDLLDLKREMNALLKKELFGEMKELSQIFAKTECKFIKGKKVFGLKLKGMKGMLGKEIGLKRFGSELSAYAKAGGVTGIIHRDELPAYGITNIEADKIAKVLDCNEKDNYVFMVAEKEKAEKAIGEIKKRISMAFKEVPKETRGAEEDGSSTYQRPLSSAARMYPETDLATEIINEKYLKEIKKDLPKTVEEREKYYKKLGLSSNHIDEMKLNNFARFFEYIVEKGANPKVSANFLLQTFTELKRENINIEEMSLGDIEELLLAEKEGKINKSSLKELAKKIVNGTTIKEAISSASEKTNSIDNKKIQEIIGKVVKKNKALIKEKKFASIGPLMGDLMKEKELKVIDGKILSEMLKKEILKIK